MRRKAAPLSAIIAAVLVAGVGSASSGAKPPSPWQKVGKMARIDLPAGFGAFKDVDKQRAGVQVEARVQHDAAQQRLRFVSEGEGVLGEAADGGFAPQDSLGAGRRLFAVGGDPSGRARLWRPAFDAARTLVALDPQMPCREAVDAATPLAGPFEIVVPPGASPGGAVLPEAPSALVFPGGDRKQRHGLRIETGGGVGLASSKHKHDVARGGFAFGGAVFAYGVSKGKPTVWTPELNGRSTKLESARFGACTDGFDGTATPVLEPAEAVNATIGRSGGSLAAGGVSLTVPAGALSEDHSITMTPLTDFADSPLEGTLIGGVKLEPEGLLFLKPALLTMPLPSGVAPVDVIGFGSAGDGSDLHLAPRSIAGGTITLQLWHFSTGGASSGGAAAAAAIQGHQPSTAEAQALQRIAAAETACAAEQAQGIVNGPACTQLQQETVRALFDWYTNSVRPGLEQAVGAPSFQVEAAIGEWLYWQQEVEARLNDLQGRCGSLENECNQAHALATQAVADMAQRRLQNCTGTSLASQFRDVARVADFVDQAAIDLTSAPLPANLRLPADLLHACAHLKIEVTDFPAVAALLYSNTLRGRVTVDVYNGADRTDVPFGLTVGGSPVSAAADGSFQTTITPTATPVNILLQATATNVVLQNTSFDASTTLAKTARERVELEALGPVAITPGGTVTLRARVAGDAMAGATLTYSSQGIGSLGATSGTTNEQGEAPLFVYTAPSEPAGGDATIAAALGDATDSLMITVEAEPETHVRFRSPPTSPLPAPGGPTQLCVDLFDEENTHLVGVTTSWSHSGAGSLGGATSVSNGQGVACIAYNHPSSFDPDTPSATVTARATHRNVEGSDSVSLTIEPEPELEIAVAVGPSPVTLSPGIDFEFQATVSNASNPAVTWSATGGTITQSGLYTPGSTRGTFEVTARSVEDSSRSASAVVVIEVGIVSLDFSTGRTEGGAQTDHGGENESGTRDTPGGLSLGGGGAVSFSSTVPAGSPGGSGTATASGAYNFSIGGAPGGVTSIAASMSSSAQIAASGQVSATAGNDSFVHVIFTISGGRVPFRLSGTGTTRGVVTLRTVSGLVLFTTGSGGSGTRSGTLGSFLPTLQVELVVESHALTCNCFAFPSSETNSASVTLTFGQS